MTDWEIQRGPDHAPFPGLDEDEGSGIDIRRVASAVFRYKWLILLAGLLGASLAALAWTRMEVRYTATGSLWVQQERSGANIGDVAPIRQSGLFETNAYIELLRSLAVLLPVVDDQRLYLVAPRGERETFSGLTLDDRFLPGAYVLEADESGSTWTLTHDEAGVIDRGAFGEAAGEDAGFSLVPTPDLVPAGEHVRFHLLAPQEAARRLGDALVTSSDREGNFVRVSYSGTDPVRITEILNAVMESHVDVAAQLKRNRLDEIAAELENQLVYAQDALTSAEQELEAFRVETITLPSDRASPIAPGIELTRGPVFDNFFRLQIDLDAVRRDRERIAAILGTLPDSTVPVETLEAIPSSGSSRELQAVLNELVELRGQLRVLRDRYSDEYPPIQELVTRESTIREQTVPRILRGILRELDGEARRLAMAVDSSSSELAEIPIRSIEEARLERQVAIQETLHNELRSRVETARLALASSVPDVRILDRAMEPTFAADDPRPLAAAVLLLGSLGAALVGALVLDRVDSRVRYPTQVDREMGLHILGSIPRLPEVGASTEQQAAVLEAFRELRIGVGFAFGAAGPVTLTVSSPSQGEGKSFISTNLAVAFADVGRRTLLIDGDTRRGDAHRLLGQRRSPGLTDYLKERTSGEIIQTTSFSHLDFIGSGTRGAHTPELLASSQMSDFLGTLKRAYDVIVIDSPPLSGGGDALVLASLTGHLAVVIRTGSTDRALAAAKVQSLTRFPIRVLGAILNDVDPRGLYGYYSAYLPAYLTKGDAEGDDPDAGLGAALVAPTTADDQGD